MSRANSADRLWPHLGIQSTAQEGVKDVSSIVVGEITLSLLHQGQPELRTSQWLNNPVLDRCVFFNCFSYAHLYHMD